MTDACANSVECRSNDTDGISPVYQHADSILVEVYTLVECLLVAVVPNAVLSQLSVLPQEEEGASR